MKKEVLRKLKESICQDEDEKTILKIVGICWECQRVCIESVNRMGLLREILNDGMFCEECRSQIKKIAVIRKMWLSWDIEKKIKRVVNEERENSKFESVGYSFYRLYQE